MSVRCKPRARLEDLWTDVDGVMIYARARRPPTLAYLPVILVHGLVVASPAMLPTAKCLATRFQVYVPDLPGFGRSAKPSYALNVAQLADVLAAWMRKVGTGPAALLGNSFSCQILVDFAVHHPDLVERLILVGPTLAPIERNVFNLITRTALTSVHEPLSLLWLTVRSWLNVGLWRGLQTIRFMLNDQILPKLPEVRIPTLVVRGTNDYIAPQNWVEKVVDSLPRGCLAVLPGAAHALAYDEPARLTRIVELFLLEGCPGYSPTFAPARKARTASSNWRG
jgi:2-hydroxy-6-oxonona-2,4-dienedioate hydrolase